MESFVLYYLTTMAPLGYVLAFLGAVIEGDTTVFIVGFLTQNGYFNPLLMYLTLAGGSLLGDLAWYEVGRHMRRTNSRIYRWAERVGEPFDARLTKRPLRTIALSKFAYGLNHAMIMRAGMLHLPLKQLMKHDVVATLPWIIIVGALGYGSSGIFLHIKSYLRYAEIGLLIAIVSFYLFEHFIITKILRRKL